MSEKIKCPERDSNLRHPGLMGGALITELPRQPQWSESNVSFQGTSISRHLLPGLTDQELLLLIVETQLIGPDAVDHIKCKRHISNNVHHQRDQL